MTDRERILAAIRGDVPDRLPWVPRLEFWYRACRRKGTLPEEFRSLNLVQIAEQLGIGCYSVVPDFTECDPDRDMLDRTLGIFSLPVLPYRVLMHGVDRKVTRHDHHTVVEYHTPVGSIRTATTFTEEMLDAGASMSWVTEPAIREPRDFDVVGYIFSHLEVVPQVEGYLERRRAVGDRGIVIGYATGTACPTHHIMKELMPVDQFFYALHDYPEKVEALADRMKPFYAGIQRCAAESPAEVILLGGNYDDSITYPPFFRKHILPALRGYAEELHARGKYLLTHTDGENRRLLPLYLEAGFDVADSVCPYPMTHCRLDDLLATFAGRIAIWGGIPSVVLCPGSATWDDCRRYVDELIARHGRSTRLILGVSDMVTADVEWDRFLYITEQIARLN